MKRNNKTMRASDDMRSEYDFSGGVRGKYYKDMQAGYTITIHQANGTTVVQEVKPRKGTIVLAPDVQEYFPNSESVNSALRNLIQLIPDKRKTAIKKAQGMTGRRRVAPGKRGRSLRS